MPAETEFDVLLKRAESSLERAKLRLQALPDDNAEVLALLGSTYVREAQIYHREAGLMKSDRLDLGEQSPSELRTRSKELLHRAKAYYGRACEKDLQAAYLVQFIALSVVCARPAPDFSNPPFRVFDEPRDRWRTARFMATEKLKDGNALTVAWAHVDLAELAILAEVLIDETLRPLGEPGSAQLIVAEHAAKIVEMGERDLAFIATARSHFRRYPRWYAEIAPHMQVCVPAAQAVVRALQ